MSILLCCDGSPSAKHAISARARSVGAHGVGGPSIAELERLSLERAQEIDQQGHELARELGLAVSTRTERTESSVWRAILELAAETDAELIVIGTHGTTAVQSLLLGSACNPLVHHSNRPVLVVRTEAR